MITDDVIASGIPVSILGMALIVLVWGFFEGFNYVVICDKINRRYLATNQWLDYGAIICAIVNILFHPFSTSFWGVIQNKKIVGAVVPAFGIPAMNFEGVCYNGVRKAAFSAVMTDVNLRCLWQRLF
ncbi:MAG: hypothetical protein UIQ90_10995 [Eisenbergiella sp.]